ncbi:MAG: ABC transporter ATP-binding protein [Deltaproteobacteria bacterium]|nr:ABC transporter ATP-binding protein [Deltaproteobacteria bacterium]
MGKPVIELEGLRKEYKPPFKWKWRKVAPWWVTLYELLKRPKIAAVDGITLDVHEGESFGFLGPNGAGKTTTIRVLMGLIKASGGRAKIFGEPVPSQAAQRRIGFLPEAPYFYDYLNVEELLDLVGRLFGQGQRARRKRADQLIEQVGLGHARRQPMKKFSKGMLQRAGLAQALMNDPDLVVFDEPMSGLDPVGRKEVRDIIQSLRDRGKTVFFSSHILADVEMICDRVAIIGHGRLHEVGTIRELVRDSVAATEVVLHLDGEIADEVVGRLAEVGQSHRKREDDLYVVLGPEADVGAFLSESISAGLKIVSVTPRHETLEDVFIRSAASIETEEDGES